MKKLRITLRSDLCAGSGESFGNSVDTDICISDAGLPYIPARRLKGCRRAEAVQLKKYGSKLATDENIQRLFGGKNGFEGILVLENAVLDGAESMECWLKSVNADPSAEPILKDTARPGSVASLFSYVRGQTKMQKLCGIEDLAVTGVWETLKLCMMQKKPAKRQWSVKCLKMNKMHISLMRVS